MVREKNLGIICGPRIICGPGSFAGLDPQKANTIGVLSKDANGYCYYTVEAAVLLKCDLSQHVAFKTAMLYEKAILFNIGQYLENKLVNINPLPYPGLVKF